MIETFKTQNLWLASFLLSQKMMLKEIKVVDIGLKNSAIFVLEGDDIEEKVKEFGANQLLVNMQNNFYELKKLMFKKLDNRNNR